MKNIIKNYITKRKNEKAKKEYENFRTAEAFTLNETRVIVNALVNAGIIGEESVEENMEADDLLTDVILRPGHNTIKFKAQEN